MDPSFIFAVAISIFVALESVSSCFCDGSNGFVPNYPLPYDLSNAGTPSYSQPGVYGGPFSGFGPQLPFGYNPPISGPQDGYFLPENPFIPYESPIKGPNLAQNYQPDDYSSKYSPQNSYLTPFYGSSSPFYGNSVPFVGCAATFYGQPNPFYGFPARYGHPGSLSGFSAPSYEYLSTYSAPSGPSGSSYDFTGPSGAYSAPLYNYLPPFGGYSANSYSNTAYGYSIPSYDSWSGGYSEPSYQNSPPQSNSVPSYGNSDASNGYSMPSYGSNMNYYSFTQIPKYSGPFFGHSVLVGSSLSPNYGGYSASQDRTSSYNSVTPVVQYSVYQDPKRVSKTVRYNETNLHHSPASSYSNRTQSSNDLHISYTNSSATYNHVPPSPPPQKKTSHSDHSTSDKKPSQTHDQPSSDSSHSYGKNDNKVDDYAPSTNYDSARSPSYEQKEEPQYQTSDYSNTYEAAGLFKPYYQPSYPYYQMELPYPPLSAANNAINIPIPNFPSGPQHLAKSQYADMPYPLPFFGPGGYVGTPYPMAPYGYDGFSVNFPPNVYADDYRIYL